MNTLVKVRYELKLNIKVDTVVGLFTTQLCHLEQGDAVHTLKKNNVEFITMSNRCVVPSYASHSEPRTSRWHRSSRRGRAGRSGGPCSPSQNHTTPGSCGRTSPLCRLGGDRVAKNRSYKHVRVCVCVCVCVCRTDLSRSGFP